MEIVIGALIVLLLIVIFAAIIAVHSADKIIKVKAGDITELEKTLKVRDNLNLELVARAEAAEEVIARQEDEILEVRRRRLALEDQYETLRGELNVTKLTLESTAEGSDQRRRQILTLEDDRYRIAQCLVDWMSAFRRDVHSTPHCAEQEIVDRFFGTKVRANGLLLTGKDLNADELMRHSAMVLNAHKYALALDTKVVHSELVERFSERTIFYTLELLSRKGSKDPHTAIGWTRDSLMLLHMEGLAKRIKLGRALRIERWMHWKIEELGDLEAVREILAGLIEYRNTEYVGRLDELPSDVRSQFMRLTVAKPVKADLPAV